jgi:hypothetical protein
LITEFFLAQGSGNFKGVMENSRAQATAYRHSFAMTWPLYFFAGEIGPSICSITVSKGV